MSYHDDGYAQLFVYVFHERQNLPRGFRIERAGGLVAKQNLRLGCQSPCYGYPLFLPSRQLCRIGLFFPFEADERQKTASLRFGLRFFHSRKSERKSNVFQAVPLHQEVEALENHCYFSAGFAKLAAFLPGDVRSVEKDLPFARFFQKIYTPDECAFACAAHSYYSEYFAVFDLDVHRLQSFHLSAVGYESF